MATAHFEQDAVRKNERIVDDRERRVLAHECDVRRLDACEVDLAGGEGGELGRRLVDHDDDEPCQRGRPAEGGGKRRVGDEDPTAVGLVRYEAEWSVPDWVPGP